MLFILIASFEIWVNLIGVNAITPNNPCDPIKSNVSACTVLKSNLLDVIADLNLNSLWFRQPMTYVNCSKRGLDKIPQKVYSNDADVEILDLSSNVISHVKKEDFVKFRRLQVLWLYSNCIGDMSNRHFYCTGFSAVYENDAFSLLLELKVLNIGGNAFTSLPVKLPTSLQYLDISRTGIMKIEVSDLSYLCNLQMFDANNLCLLETCENQLHIDNNTFENLPIEVLQLSENRKIFNLLSDLALPSLIYVNFAQTHGALLGPEHLNNATTVKRIDMYLLNPNDRIRLNVLNNTFDKLQDLEYLDLSSNMIETLPTNIFRQNHKLTYLDLSGNCLYLTVLDPTYVPEQIKYLYLGYNYCHSAGLGNVNPKQSNYTSKIHYNLGPSFLKMKNLTILSYAKPRNQGTAIQMSTLITFHEVNNNTLFNLLQLDKLSQIIINDNYIKEIDMSTLSCIPNLSKIDFYNNIIDSINVSQQPCNIQPFAKTAHKLANCSTELKIIFSYNKIGLYLLNSELVHPKASWIDLQYNLVSSIHEEAFKHMLCLTYIDLRNNPLTFIKSNTFKNLLRLNTIRISSTSIIRLVSSFSFLKTLVTSPFLQLALTNENLFDKLRYIDYHANYVLNVDLSDNLIPSVNHIEIGLKVFRNAKSLVLQRCGIKFSNFSLPNPALTYLDLSQNKIEEVMPRVLESVPLLESLKLSLNSLTQLNIDLFELLPHLENLDLSQNHISVMTTNKTASKRFKKLKKLNLQNNYILELGEDIFSLHFLLKLEYLDLRWNSIECDCQMTQTFGMWLSTHSYKLIDRPGFLPQCSSSVQSFGGCVACESAIKQHKAIIQPLLLFSTTNLCSTSFNLFLFVSFTSVFICFSLTSLFFSSSKGMLWLAKISTRKVRLHNVDEDDATLSGNFAFHGFVLFDTEDIHAAEWVDHQLVPQLTHGSSGMKIILLGRDDQCGFSYATQILRKIEASRKVIIVLTGGFWQSCIRNFVLSAIEDLYCQTGYDRSVFITFDSDGHVGGLLRRQRKKSLFYVFQFPDDQRYSSIFWESLRSSLLSE